MRRSRHAVTLTLLALSATGMLAWWYVTRFQDVTSRYLRLAGELTARPNHPEMLTERLAKLIESEGLSYSDERVLSASMHLLSIGKLDRDLKRQLCKRIGGELRSNRGSRAKYGLEVLNIADRDHKGLFDHELIEMVSEDVQCQFLDLAKRQTMPPDNTEDLTSQLTATTQSGHVRFGDERVFSISIDLIAHRDLNYILKNGFCEKIEYEAWKNQKLCDDYGPKILALARGMSADMFDGDMIQMLVGVFGETGWEIFAKKVGSGDVELRLIDNSHAQFALWPNAGKTLAMWFLNEELRFNGMTDLSYFRYASEGREFLARCVFDTTLSIGVREQCFRSLLTTIAGIDLLLQHRDSLEEFDESANLEQTRHDIFAQWKSRSLGGLIELAQSNSVESQQGMAVVTRLFGTDDLARADVVAWRGTEYDAALALIAEVVEHSESYTLFPVRSGLTQLPGLFGTMPHNLADLFCKALHSESELLRTELVTASLVDPTLAGRKEVLECTLRTIDDSSGYSYEVCRRLVYATGKSFGRDTSAWRAWMSRYSNDHGSALVPR